MSTGGSRFWVWVLTGFLTLVIAFFLNVVLSETRAQIDLTEDNRYTLPEAAVRIASTLQDDLRVTVYLSEALPSYLGHLRRALDVRLGEFVKASNGRISYEFVSPDGDKNLQEELGKRTPKIEPVPLQEYTEGKAVSTSCYLWLSFRYGDQESAFWLGELRQAIFSEGEVLKLLPFQIAARIVKLTNPEKKMGIFSEKKMPPRESAAPGQNPEATDGLKLFRDSIERHMPKPVDVALKGGGAIPEVDTLIVYRPESLDERTVFELDQYLMRGKRVVVLLDNLSLFEVDRFMEYQSSFIQPLQMGAARGEAPKSAQVKVRAIDHGLKDWLAHFGVLVGEGWVEDASCAKSVHATAQFVPVNGRLAIQTVNTTLEMPGYVVALEQGEDKKPTGQFSLSSPALAGLGRLAMAYPVPMSLDPDAVARHGKGADGSSRVRAEEILRTSPSAWVRKLEGDTVSLTTAPDAMNRPAATEWGSRSLVIAVDGSFKSFFAGKTFGEADRPPRKGPDGKDLPEPPAPAAKLDESTARGQLWVFADADFASDFAGAQWQGSIPNQLKSAVAAQGLGQMLVGLVNTLDTITVGNDLVDIRRPQLVDRTIEAEKVTADKTKIKFLAVGLAPVAIIVIGFLWWLVRSVMTRVKSPSLRSRAPEVTAS